MARNKFPEETVNKILDVSFRLFQEKGYEHTTIQDITNALGMSKGAIYHHFTSKEDILDKISERYYDSVDWFSGIREDPTLNGLQKLRAIMRMQLTDPGKLEMDTITLSLTDNPQLLALTLNSVMYDATPMVSDLIEAGVRDGSIVTKFPRELGEAFMLLINIWVGVYTSSTQEIMTKFRFLKDMTDALGMPLIDDDLLRDTEEYFRLILPHA